MSILVTGASGFIGQTLASSLLSHQSSPSLILTDISPPPVPTYTSPTSPKRQSLAADLTSSESRAQLLRAASPLKTVYILHGIMSSGSESNLELGLRVNLDATRSLLDDLRTHHPGVRVIYTSSCAVYGPQPSPFEEHLFTEASPTPTPLSSYGTQKLMIEALVNDYSRRGLLDGVVVRLPTVIIRPGKPTAAASSFASGIFREPLAGVEALLPVKPETRLWNCSVKIVVKNLVYAGVELDTKRFREVGANDRRVNLPGKTMSVREMLDALEAVGGKEVRGLVREERDGDVERIVEGWAVGYDTLRARRLGFAEEQELEETVKDYIDGFVKK
ncbi:MAG: hypothetical protein M1820_005093 [Bogoriella megaspora]|nr:MAG: hypothetical protein M1820_005093 [Bogoriella megaspora]